MNYSDLVKSVATATGADQVTVDKVLKGLTVAVTDAVKAGESVSIPSFCTFKPKHMPARVGRNPSTGEAMNIDAKNSLSVSLSKGLKDALNASA